jgi:WD40 repeat protein
MSFLVIQEEIVLIEGSEDGKIVIWNLETGEEVTRLEGHLKPSLHVKFHPKNLLLVSACKSLMFWLPQNFGTTA